MPDSLIYWFVELRREHSDLVGKKCANLGEMVHMGLRVPPGFAVSVEAYTQFMKRTGADEEIRQYVRNARELKNNVKKQIEASQFIREQIESKELPQEMKIELWDYYAQLCQRAETDDLPVATRSSGAISMPGQMDTFLNVRGKQDLANKVVKVWGSAFTTRAIAFRLQHGMPIEKAQTGVAILKMINAKCAGVALTVQPTKGDVTKIVVEGNWGLGESVVSGEITPDYFIVDKESGDTETKISEKRNKVVYTESGTGMTAVSEDMRQKPCLAQNELEEIVRIAKKVEAHFGVPQDMEWVFDNENPFPRNLFWVQTRPATYTNKIECYDDYLAELMTRIFKTKKTAKH